MMQALAGRRLYPQIMIGNPTITKFAHERGVHFPMKQEVPIWEKANQTIEEAAACFGIGMNKLRPKSEIGVLAVPIT